MTPVGESSWLAHLRRPWLQLTLITLLGFLAYSNTFQVPFVLDDNYSIEFFGTSGILNTLLHGTSRRVTDLTFAINYQLHALRLPGYHITNLAIHLMAAATLYALVHAVIRSQLKHISDDARLIIDFLPCAVTLLFIAHPLQTQAVTYTIQRYTSLATLFYLFSTLAFIRCRTLLDESGASTKTWLWGAASVISALLSLGSKQIAATLPLALMLLEYVLFNGRYLTKRFFIVCGTLLMILPAVLLYQWVSGNLSDFLFDLRRATSDNRYMTRFDYFLTQNRVVVTYLRLLVAPFNQNLFYDYPEYRTLFALPVLASMALHIACSVAALFMIRTARNRDAAAPCTSLLLRLAGVGIIWFYLTLAVESSFIPIRDVIFEHRVYLPSPGFFLTACSLGLLLALRRPNGMRTLWLAIIAISLTLGIATFNRNSVWVNAISIWADTARKSPNKGLVQANLAAEYLKSGQADKALPLYLKAIELNPSLDFRVKTGLGGAMRALNLFPNRFTTGHEYILPGGDFNSGALNFGDFNRWEAVINNNRGLAYEYFGDTKNAWSAYETALWVSPNYELAWFNFGLLAAKLQKWEKTGEALARLKELNPALETTLRTEIRNLAAQQAP